MPDPTPFEQRLRDMLEKHQNFLLTTSEHELGQHVLDEVGRFQMLDTSETALDTEQVYMHLVLGARF